MTTAGGQRETVDAVLDALGDVPYVLLDSGDGSGDSAVLLPTGPRLVDDGHAVRLDDVIWQEHASDPFTALDALCERFGLGPADEGGGVGGDTAVTGSLRPRGASSTAAGRSDGGPPIVACLAGVLSYDLARRVESLAPTWTSSRAADDRGLPLLDLTLCEVAVVVEPDGRTRVDVDDRGGGGAAAAAEVAGAAVREVPFRATPRRVTGPRRGAVASSRRREAYVADVGRVLGHVAAGDTFQVNLSHRLTTTWSAGAAELYRALRDASPARYGAVARLGEAVVASISPETFLVARGRDVLTRPIKGTRPRSDDPVEDARLADDLVRSPKDRAENVMVVDMERNDLGRVCEPGTVRVPRLLQLEAHPTVWHLVSDVTGTLRDGVGWGGLLRATFPCGSVTGTPKVRAMQVIESLEPVRRHAYCGAIGVLGDGRLDLSVAIRTATLMPDGTADYGAGGGVVADSDPADEHAETLAKAAAFLTAVGVRSSDG